MQRIIDFFYVKPCESGVVSQGCEVNSEKDARNIDRQIKRLSESDPKNKNAGEVVDVFETFVFGLIALFSKREC